MSVGSLPVNCPQVSMQQNARLFIALHAKLANFALQVQVVRVPSTEDRTAIMRHACMWCRAAQTPRCLAQAVTYISVTDHQCSQTFVPRTIRSLVKAYLSAWLPAWMRWQQASWVLWHWLHCSFWLLQWLMQPSQETCRGSSLDII